MNRPHCFCCLFWRQFFWSSCGGVWTIRNPWYIPLDLCTLHNMFNSIILIYKVHVALGYNQMFHCFAYYYWVSIIKHISSHWKRRVRSNIKAGHLHWYYSKKKNVSVFSTLMHQYGKYMYAYGDLKQFSLSTKNLNICELVWYGKLILKFKLSFLKQWPSFLKDQDAKDSNTRSEICSVLEGERSPRISCICILVIGVTVLGLPTL